MLVFQGPGLSQKGQLFDRSNVLVMNTYSAAGVAPHANTTRFTHTVPANTIEFYPSCYLRMFRDLAATGVGLALAQFLIAATLQDEIGMYNLALGTLVNTGFAVGLYVPAGTVVAAQTQDGSTGGTLNFNLEAQANQFNA